MHRGLNRRRDVPIYLTPPRHYHFTLAMNSKDQFKVIVRGSKFTLTQSMVEFDSPNYFTACFLGEFRESQTRTIEIWRDPTLFAIILDYLCGYTVFPLKETQIPSRMTLATAVLNLRADAEFYQLDGLVQACDDQIDLNSKQSENRFMVISGTRLDFGFEGN